MVDLAIIIMCIWPFASVKFTEAQTWWLDITGICIWYPVCLACCLLIRLKIFIVIAAASLTRNVINGTMYHVLSNTDSSGSHAMTTWQNYQRKELYSHKFAHKQALPFEANDRSVTPKDRLTTPSENDKSFARSTAKFVTRRTGQRRAQTLLHAVQAFSYLLIKRRATSGSGHARSQPSYVHL